MTHKSRRAFFVFMTMIIPSSHIAFLAFAYAFEYLYRAKSMPGRKYLYIGKAFGRLLLAGAYLYISIFDTTSITRQFAVRWSLVIFLGTDLFFIAQDHVMRWWMSKHAKQH